VPLH